MPMTDPGFIPTRELREAWERTQAAKAEAERTATRPRKSFTIEWVNDLKVDVEERPWLIEELLPAGPSLGMCFGWPKSLKSFGLMDAIFHVTLGREYGGKRVQKTGGIYITSEAVPGVRRRLIAMRQQLQVPPDKFVPMGLIGVVPDLGTGPGDAKQLIDDIKRQVEELKCEVGVIAMDTLRRAMPGRDENQPKDLGAVIGNCELIIDAFKPTLAFVHHSPRSDNKRTSGTNAGDAASDWQWGFERNDVGAARRAAIHVAMMKDGEAEGTEWEIELVPHRIGTRKDKQPIDACAVEMITPPGRPAEDEEPKSRAGQEAKTLTPKRQQMFDIVREALADAGQHPDKTAGVPHGIKAVSRSNIAKVAQARGWKIDKPENLFRAHLSNALNELNGLHVVGLSQDWVWITPQI
jgi:AAA domain